MRLEKWEPPESVVSSGRINPEGISYLYISESAETAIAEVLLWRGALVSVGEFEIRKELRIVSLVDGEQRAAIFDPVDVEVTKDRFKNSIFSGVLKSLYFSTPAYGNDKLAYLPSQYLAECFKHADIDGIKYSSVLRNGGVNLVLFEQDVAECKSVMQYRVNSVEYSSLPF